MTVKRCTLKGKKGHKVVSHTTGRNLSRCYTGKNSLGKAKKRLRQIQGFKKRGK